MKQERQPMLSRASCTHNEEHRSLGRSRLNFSIRAGVAAHPAGGNGAGWVHGTGRAKLCAPVQAAAVCALMAPSLCLRQPCCQQEAGQTLADSHGITTISISTSILVPSVWVMQLAWRRAAPIAVPGALQEVSGEEDAASSCCCVWTAYTGHVSWQCCVYALWDKGRVEQWIKQGGLAKPCWILISISTTEQPRGFACGCSTFCFPSSPGLRALLSISFHMAVRSNLTCSAGRRLHVNTGDESQCSRLLLAVYSKASLEHIAAWRGAGQPIYGHLPPPPGRNLPCWVISLIFLTLW